MSQPVNNQGKMSGENPDSIRRASDRVSGGAAAKSWYLSAFEAFEKGLNGEASSGIHAIRRAAIARFAALGFPTTHDEEWKYTDVSSLAAVRFRLPSPSGLDSVTPEQLEPFLFGSSSPNTLVWINGHFSGRHSVLARTPANGVRVESLAAAMKSGGAELTAHLGKYASYQDNAFTALSTAFFQDGALVSVPDGTVLEDPIHLLFVSSDAGGPMVSHPRNLFLIGRNCQLSILESHRSLTPGACFTNGVSEIRLGENSVLEYHQLQDERDLSYHVGMTHAHQERNSNFISHSISLGGSLVRNNIVAVLDGEGAECTLNGLYLTTGNQHVDNHTLIDHAKPHCNSHELYKGILDGTSRGVFNGKIMVRKDAQKTDAKQTNKNLVLSDGASIDTKPQLEIFASDVKCTHGATIGQLDEEAIFYLRSRGIGGDHARDILIDAFAGDVVDRIKILPVRDRLHEIIHLRLETGRKTRERK
jgi:Fe-S cluster assembly protein SufD